MSPFDIVGSVGVVIIIATYFLLQTGRLRSGDLGYSMANAVGAGFIAFSLIFNFNLPAFIVEVFWFLISIFGIIKSIGNRSK